MSWPKAKRPAGTSGARVTNSGGQPDNDSQNKPPQSRKQPPEPLDIGDARFRRAVQHLHRLGSRVMFELLTEIGRTRTCRTQIETMVDEIVDLDPHVLRAFNGDRMPPVPLHEAPRCRGR